MYKIDERETCVASDHQCVYWKGVQARVSSILPSLSLWVWLSSSCISAQALLLASPSAACCLCTSSDTASLGRGFFTNIFIFLSLFIFFSGFCISCRSES